MRTILVTRDTKGKCRVIEMNLIHNNDDTYTITRFSGLIDGKKTAQPEIRITKGKVKRNTQQQSELKYNALIKKARDKGYKTLEELGITDLSEVESVLGEEKTDQNGSIKPQLCDKFNKNNKKHIEKTWLASYKHDGTRCLLYYRDGEVKTASRGGTNYDIPATYIRQDPYIVSLFEKDPDLILDGEIYVHSMDWKLNRLSGLCRKETLEEDHKELKFYCYDVVRLDLPFSVRATILGRIRDDCSENTRLVIVNHVPVKGVEEIMKLHDQAINEGYEGLVLRDPEKTYNPGSRSNMYKVKIFSDDEFLITGLVEGLREEDMCFLMETEEGYEFKAKPIGTREEKQWYRENIDTIIGKKGTVKFFGFTNTDTPVPNLPVFVTVRYDI